MTTSKSADPMIAPAGPTSPAANIAVLQGRLTSEPTRRELPSGRAVVQFDISTQIVDGERVASVSSPVAWLDAGEAACAALVAGGEYLVVGSVRRRFFRVGGATQSRTEVVADQVIKASRRKQVDAALAEVISRLGVAKIG